MTLAIETRGVQDGMVAVFDILGYKNILAHNEIDFLVKVILRELRNSVKQASRESLRLIPQGSKPPVNQIVRAIQKRVFADTILLTLDNGGASPLPARWFVFLYYCSVLQRHMFEKGLPLRGAVSAGRFYIDRFCFVGKPILSAYELEKRQDWCGVALTVEAEQSLRESFARDRQWEFSFAKFLICADVPQKGCGVQQLISLPWPSIPLKSKKLTDAHDIRGVVVSCFTAHGKEAGATEYSKIENTEKFIKHCKERAKPLSGVRGLQELHRMRAAGDSNATMNSKSGSRL